MLKHYKTVILLLFLLTSISAVHVKAASSYQINDLIERENTLDGQEVTVQGEAIGESMDRGDYAWVNINDGGNAIGVWMKKGEADTIRYYGNYGIVGDTITLTGTFHKACKEHGGDTDLHVATIHISQEGHVVKAPIIFAKIVITVVTLLITFIVFILYLKIQRSAKLFKQKDNPKE